jgi:uncharacterized protein YdeI (YjbR/CyaY-like superfamily)
LWVSELRPANVAEWRRWLEQHHESEPEVWLVYWKKKTGRPTVTWEEAVVEAIRYGWIDGLRRPIDDERHKQRFTPRRPRSRWSKINRATAQRLIAAGEMSAAGLAAVEAGKASGEWDRAYTVQPPIPAPEDLKAAIAASPVAKHAFRRMYRPRYERWLGWLEAGPARERTRRIARIVAALESGDNASLDEIIRDAGRG